MSKYVDDDFVSKLLTRWPLTKLVQYSKLLVLLINRRTAVPSGSSLPPRLSTRVHYKYPSEYYETLFADYTTVGKLSFRAHYTRVYKEAEQALHQQLSDEQRLQHGARLRACFIVGLTYDARIRRFVFSKHDLHYKYMQTHPPAALKTSHFIERLRPAVDEFLEQRNTAESLSEQACTLWIAHYMFI